MKILKRTEINTEKWDACIANSTKPLIYGVSWFLDAATNQQWDGVVWGNYDAVMPLPWNKKLIKKQVYIPFSIQQLGPFYPHENYDLGQYISLIDSKFIQTHLSLYVKPSSFTTHERRNFILDLNRPYERIKRGYNQNRKRQIKYENEAYLIKSLTYSHFFTFYRREAAQLVKKSGIEISQYMAIAKECDNRDAAKFYAIFVDNKPLSAIFLSCFGKRMTHQLSVSSKEGYSLNSNTKLIDAVIKKYANEHLILDFEGSEIPGIKQYFKSFGAEPEFYYHYQKLNPLVQILKKGLILINPLPNT